MSGFEYRAAHDSGWTLLVHGSRLVFVEAGRPELRDELWRTLETHGDDGQLLDALTRGGIGSAPGFALCTARDGELSLVLRGALRFDTPSGEQLDARQATAWLEHRMPAQPGWVLDGAGDGEWLPLIGGMVGASAVRQVAEGAERMPAPAAEAPAAPAPAPAPPTAPAPAPAPAPPPAPEMTIASERTIDRPAADTEPPEAAAEAGSEYDELFGATIARSIEDAAVRPEVEEEEDSAAVSDGSRTVVATDIAALRAQRRAERGAAPPAPASPRFSLRSASGSVEPLTDIVLIGRAPTASRVPASRVPRLVTVASKDVSRTHVQAEVAGDAVVVTDLHSSNGTMIVIPGQSPQRLRAGEPATVIPGTVIDLGDGVEFTLEAQR